VKINAGSLSDKEKANTYVVEADKILQQAIDKEQAILATVTSKM
jgi:formiminotetrahydrofolate cyclodeaminase